MVMACDAMPTIERYAANPADRAIVQAATAPGDGLVLRVSALLDARQGRDPAMRGAAVVTPMDLRRAPILPREHLGITRDPTFRNNILYWLLEEPRGGVTPAAARRRA
jgi:hypothetical protein